MQVRKTPCILLCIAGTLLFYACNKANQDATPPKPKIPKIKTVFAMAGNDSDLRTYSYDAGGRVTLIKYSLYGKDEFAYTDTGIVRKYSNLNDSLLSTTVYRQGSGGLIMNYTASGSPNDTYVSTYNPDGQPLTFTETRTMPGQAVRTWLTNYYYTNQNLDSSIVTFTYNGPAGSSALYYDEYYTDKTNTLGNDNYGQGWLGASSKNPPKVARDIGQSNGVYPQTTYQYDYDSLGRITKQMHFWGNSAFTPVFYTYY